MDPTIDRARRPIRRRLEKLLKDLDKLLSSDVIDKSKISGRWRVIEEEYQRLYELDNQARNYLVQTDATVETEVKSLKKRTLIGQEWKICELQF